MKYNQLWGFIKKNYFWCMKKWILAITCISLLSSCAVFQKKEKLGCASDGRNVGAEKLLSGDSKESKAAGKAKYRGGRKSY
jgi:hypothetical protein